MTVRVKALDAVQVRVINRKYHTIQSLLAGLLLASAWGTAEMYADSQVAGLILCLLVVSLGAAGLASVELSRREAIRMVTGEHW